MGRLQYVTIFVGSLLGSPIHGAYHMRSSCRPKATCSMWLMLDSSQDIAAGKAHTLASAGLLSRTSIAVTLMWVYSK